MAHIEDRWKRDGRRGAGLRWRVRYLDPSGAERSKSFARKADAERFMNATAADVARGTWFDPDAGKITLRRFAEDWLKVQTFDPSTREMTEMRLRKHVYPALGDYALGHLASRPSLIQGWVRGLAISGNYGRVVFTTLSTILNAAVADELIPRNPCQSSSVRRPTAEVRKLEPWAAERVSAVRDGLPERDRVLCDLGAGLGLRQGECFGLAVEDIDFLRRVVHVRRQVKIVRSRQVFALPKGGKPRDIPLPGSVALALAAHLERFPARPVKLPWREPDGEPVAANLLMTSPTGLAANRNDFNRYRWAPALKAAGVAAGRDAGTHQLRHHFASVLLFHGVDIRALSEYLGHTDPGFTLRTYTHLMPSAHDRMREAIDTAARQAADGPVTAQAVED